MADTTISSDQKRRMFIAEWDEKVIRMEDQLAKALKLIAMQLQALENEMTAGMAYKQTETNANALASLQKLTASFNSLTDSKIRLDKTAKQRAEQMTPEEERDAVYTYVMAMPRKERAYFLKQAIERHNAQHEHSFVRTDKPMNRTILGLDETEEAT